MNDPRIHCLHCKREAAELKARVRELEAELAEADEDRKGLFEMCNKGKDAYEFEKARAEKAEARVAELEGTERETRLGPHNAHLQDDEQIRGCPECDKEHYAREREAAKSRELDEKARVAEQEGKIIELAERLTKEQARVAELERKLERRLTIPPDMARKFEEVEAYNAREREAD